MLRSPFTGRFVYWTAVCWYLAVIIPFDRIFCRKHERKSGDTFLEASPYLFLRHVYVDPVVRRFLCYCRQIATLLWESNADEFLLSTYPDRGNFAVSFRVVFTGNSRTTILILNVYLESMTSFCVWSCINGCFGEHFLPKLSSSSILNLCIVSLSHEGREFSGTIILRLQCREV